MYSAYCVTAPDGTFRLALFFDGFEDTEEAQLFLRHLMAPYESPHYEFESDTIH
jgi:hypothetical protein